MTGPDPARIFAFPFARRNLVAALLLLAFVMFGVTLLSRNVMNGDTQAFDEAVLRLFRTGGDAPTPIGPHWLPQVVGDLTALGSYGLLTVLTLLSAGFCVIVRRYDALGLLLVSALGAVIINVTMKALIGRARPVVVEHLAHVSSYSYPSGHALMSAAIYLSYAAIFAAMAPDFRARAYIMTGGFFLAGMVGVSRLYLGVHYPTDVLAGWSIGAAWALFCWMLVAGLRTRFGKGPDAARASL